MQLFVMLMMMAVVLHDTAPTPVEPRLSGFAMFAAALGPLLAMSLAAWGVCAFVLGRIRVKPSVSTFYLRSLNFVIEALRLTALALFFFDIFFLGWLTYLYRLLGPPQVLSDALAILAMLGVVIASWWAFYPIDRHLRGSRLISEIDSGSPVAPIWTRGQYLMSQVRVNILFTLIPLLLMLGWKEGVVGWTRAHDQYIQWKDPLIIGGAALVFFLAPLLGARILDTVPLPEGPLRDRLLRVCSLYGVRVRQLLLWRTYGGMINGAVMGLIGPVRVIMLTDGLLARLNDDEVEAVMAHELAHIKRHHMIWIIVSAMATLGAITFVVSLGVSGLDSYNPRFAAFDTRSKDMLSLLAVVPLWVIVFGYVSRRFERQADVFAVQHLSTRGRVTEQSPAPIDPVAIDVVSSALRRVANLNHVPVDHAHHGARAIFRPALYFLSLFRSWRHGSIGWRIRHLHTLAGTDVAHCRIDGVVRLICWSSAALLAAVLFLERFISTM
jgi:STE24 endopeptidase